MASLLVCLMTDLRCFDLLCDVLWLVESNLATGSFLGAWSLLKAVACPALVIIRQQTSVAVGMSPAFARERR